jgi:serine/threonine protein kinase
LSVSDVRRIDAVCDRFEEELQAGRKPCIEQALETVDRSVQTVLLRQLILLELEYGSNGKRTGSSDYLIRFPDHSELISQTLAEHEAGAYSSSGAQRMGTSEFHGNGSSGASDTDLARGLKERGYSLLERLGSSRGMGTVYLAHQTNADRLVAIKMLQEGPHVDREVLERFHREAATLANLKHPNIVPVFEVGEILGRPYYSMEYCSGGSLADLLLGSPLPSDEAARLVELLARGVYAAHQAGVIHRDLKPSNILLQAVATESRGSVESVEAVRASRWPGCRHRHTDEGPGPAIDQRPGAAQYNPKLADFGLAKRLDAEAVTNTGRILGTPQYMPPEQARGEAKVVGPAADIFGLGAIFY